MKSPEHGMQGIVYHINNMVNGLLTGRDQLEIRKRLADFCYSKYEEGFREGAKIFATDKSFDRIREWARDRNLIKGATPAAQFEKYLEECGELGRSLIENDMDNFKDAVGDCVVVLTILAAQKGVTIEDCISSAYNEIKHRTGKMVDGIFVKDA